MSTDPYRLTRGLLSHGRGNFRIMHIRTPYCCFFFRSCAIDVHWKNWLLSLEETTCVDSSVCASLRFSFVMVPLEPQQEMVLHLGVFIRCCLTSSSVISFFPDSMFPKFFPFSQHQRLDHISLLSLLVMLGDHLLRTGCNGEE